jgi:hypothetical protein
MAPLCGFPRAVFEAVYPHMVSEGLNVLDVQMLTSFYSRVDQMNRGQDSIERYRAAKDEASMQREVARFIAKAEEMQHLEGIRNRGEAHDFYAGAISTINRHLRGAA